MGLAVGDMGGKLRNDLFSLEFSVLIIHFLWFPI